MMSRNSQLRTYGDGAALVAVHPAGARYDWHRHEENQLAWASSGVLTVSTEESTWVLPASRALWIPAGIEHVTDADRHTTMQSLYIGAERGPRWTVPTPVAIGVLARVL